MRAMALAAIGSLAVFVASIVAYSLYPLPGTLTPGSWEGAGFWLSIGLLAVGLLSFVGCLVAGLVTILNWGSD